MEAFPNGHPMATRVMFVLISLIVVLPAYSQVISAEYVAEVKQKANQRWWTAVLLIKDPRTGKPFVSLYRWESRQGEWKTRKSFKFSSEKSSRVTFFL